jgi:FAD dependent oxidoreductase TIGR03364
LQFGTSVNEIQLPTLTTTRGKWSVDEVYVCSGNDFETLYPEHFAASGITRCKLQMLRTVPQPQGWQLGPSLCAGLTLTHYKSFSQLTTLEALRRRFEETMPFYVQEGIHVLLSQTALGELTIGDHHEYGLTLDPFAREAVDNAILDYLKTFAVYPNTAIAERWIGVYPLIKGKTEVVIRPGPNVTIVNALSGAGMTLSFGLADDVVRRGVFA